MIGRKLKVARSAAGLSLRTRIRAEGIVVDGITGGLNQVNSYSLSGVHSGLAPLP